MHFSVQLCVIHGLVLLDGLAAIDTIVWNHGLVLLDGRAAIGTIVWNHGLVLLDDWTAIGTIVCNTWLSIIRWLDIHRYIKINFNLAYVFVKKHKV